MRADDFWYASGVGARTARLALTPLSALYCLGARARNALFDFGIRRARSSPIPVISVGNLTVGGTGKTPITAWLSQALLAHGEIPAIVLRGYGGDEVEVHRLLSPAAVVVADADRVAGLATAAARGATVGILDDAFQHRSARRDLDIVLVEAERGIEPARCLPGGPYREPVSGLGRAHLVVITVKSDGNAHADAVRRAVQGLTGAPACVLAIEPCSLVSVTSTGLEAPLSALAGERALAVSGIGNPGAFEAQLQSKGCLVEGRRYADHHQYSRADVDEILRLASGKDRVVCTLKDAVKLGPLWPRNGRELWYVSQRVRPVMGWEQGAALLSRLMAARAQHSP